MSHASKQSSQHRPTPKGVGSGALVRLRHRLAHKLGLFNGRVETWWAKNGKLMVGFRCGVCGELTGIHPSKIGRRLY